VNVFRRTTSCTLVNRYRRFGFIAAIWSVGRSVRLFVLYCSPGYGFLKIGLGVPKRSDRYLLTAVSFDIKAGCVACVGEKINVCRFSVGNPEGKT
jgi:hypothetical protein